MIKRVSVLALVVYLSLVLSLGSAQAQGELRVIRSSAEVDFPFKLNFNLSAAGDVDITDIRLHYKLDQQGFADVTSEVFVEFVPATAVEVAWTWNMKKTGGLPPGSTVQYWWTVQDTSGKRIETTPVQIQFNDNRYSWQSLTDGGVTIYWYEGRETFAQEIMESVKQALAKLSEDTGAYLRQPARIYIYASSQDLREAMVYPQEWTGGVAFTRHGVIAIGIAPYNLSWGKRAITHELTHLVIHQMTLNPYNDLPNWLDEGLAMYSEGPLSSQFKNSLSKAIADKSLISVRSLSSPFSAYAEQSYLSYAQSYSLVEFLIGNYGREKMLELLNVFREGSSYDGALEKVYGFDMDGLDALWQDYITKIAGAVGRTGYVIWPSGWLLEAKYGGEVGKEIIYHS